MYVLGFILAALCGVSNGHQLRGMGSEVAQDAEPAHARDLAVFNGGTIKVSVSQPVLAHHWTTGFKFVVLNGWACRLSNSERLRVQLYIGGLPGTGTMVREEVADLSRGDDSAIAAACKNNHGKNSFKFELDVHESYMYRRERMYVNLPDYNVVYGIPSDEVLRVPYDAGGLVGDSNDSYIWGTLRFPNDVFNVCTNEDLEEIDRFMWRSLFRFRHRWGRDDIYLSFPPSSRRRLNTLCVAVCNQCSACREYNCVGYRCGARRLEEATEFESDVVLPAERYLEEPEDEQVGMEDERQMLEICEPDLNNRNQQAVNEFQIDFEQVMTNNSGEVSATCSNYMRNYAVFDFYADMKFPKA